MEAGARITSSRPADPGSRWALRPDAGASFDGRVIIVATLAAYGIAVSVAQRVWDLDLWHYLGVKSAPTLFYDARNVAAAADCWSMGFDPLVENPCDPAGRVMNYPRVWVLLHHAGVSQSRTLLFGAVAVAVFLAAVLLLVGRLRPREGVVVTLAVASPAVMLAIERANMDIVLFAVFVAAVFAWRARDRLTPFAAPALILGAAVAKLYAVVALPAFALTSDRRARWSVGLAFAAMGAYALLILDDLREVASAPEGGLLYSYGARILIGDLYHRFEPGEWLHGNLVAQAIAVVPVAILAVVAWVWVRRRMPVIPVVDRSTAAVLAFNLGALTYLGTFVTRKSGDYRLVFVLLTLPLLLEWAAGHRSSLRTQLARAGLAVVVVGLWIGGLSPYIGPFDELGSWAMAALFTALLAATAPPLDEIVGTRRRRRAPAPEPAATP